MSALRRLLAHRCLAVLICAAALALKLLVPAGYMIDGSHGSMTVTICSGTAPNTTMVMMAGAHGDMPGHDKSGHQGKAEMPCAFAGLSAATLGAIDPIQLAAFVAFVMAIGLAGVALPPRPHPTYLRPPLRGPPAHR